jgi:hypothetical protein
VDGFELTADILWDKVPGRGPYPRGSCLYRLCQDSHECQSRGEEGILPGCQQELWIKRSLSFGRSVIRILPVRTTSICSHDSGLTFSFGVVKAFLDADLLPRVVTGTSAGGLVAALLCTRTDAELKHLLVPRLADRITACEDAFGVWIRRWMETGARFSSIKWAEKVSQGHLK